MNELYRRESGRPGVSNLYGFGFLTNLVQLDYLQHEFIYVILPKLKILLLGASKQRQHNEEGETPLDRNENKKTAFEGTVDAFRIAFRAPEGWWQRTPSVSEEGGWWAEVVTRGRNPKNKWWSLRFRDEGGGGCKPIRPPSGHK